MRKLMETIERINEDEPCSICKGQGRPWDPYATQEGGAYRDCEACNGTGDESVRLGEPEDYFDEEKDNDEYSRCTWCKGGGREWDPYATYEGGAWKDCEACNGTGDANKFVAEGINDTEVDLKLPRGKKVVLQVEESDYIRGLIIQAKEGGGYDVEYWRENPTNIVPAEVKVDGEIIKDDAKIVYLGFHPEKGDEEA